jgi:hypothetical protein
MTPLEYLFFIRANSGLLICSKAFGKLLVEPKTLGLGTLKESFENAFENLGVVSTPLKCFQNWFLDK